MFENIFFWKNWPTRLKIVGLIPVSLFVFAVGYMWLAYFQSPAPTFTWQYIQQQKLEEIPVHQFQSGAFELTVLGDNYLIFEKLLGNPLTPNITAHYIFISVLITSVVILFSIITLLKRFWYLIGTGLFILLLVGLRFELLGVFGYFDRSFTIGLISIYVITSYYFNYFKTETSFVVRLIAFSLITLSAGIVIQFYAEVPQPLLFLSASSVTAAIILCILFIILVSHEIIASFVFVLSQGTQQKKSLNHFLIITLIYMVNLSLAYAYKFNMISWNFLYIDFFLLLTISGLLGIWGFRQQQPQYDNIIQADPFGVYFFLSMGAIAFASIAFFINTANDPAVETISNLIIYCHLGYGLIFFTYVFSNFVGLLAANMNAFKVLYQPTRMPFFTFRLAGFIATLSFVLYQTWQVPVRNTSAAYYNAMGDVYLSQGNEKVAESYFQYAGTHGFMNHHSNYAIADIGQQRYDIVKEQRFYERATKRRPTEMSYLNLSNTYERTSSWIDALLVLKKSAIKFPNSAAIENTQGILFYEIDIPDSAIYYLKKARAHSSLSSSADINLLAVAADFQLPIDVDSLSSSLSSSNDGVKSNALAYANFTNTKIELPLDLTDSTLNLFSATLINNYVLNHLVDADSVSLNRIKQLARMDANSVYSESLLSVVSLSHYAKGEVKEAVNLLKEVIFSSDRQGKYNNTLALWALEQNAPEIALRYLEFAIFQKFDPAALTKSVALSEAGKIPEAIISWDFIRTNGDTIMVQLAERMMRILAISNNLVNQLEDEEKYLYCRYRLKPTDSVQVLQIVSTITNTNYKAKTLLEFSQKLYQIDELQSAIKFFNRISEIEVTNSTLIQEGQLLELKLLAAQGNYRALETQMNAFSFSIGQKNIQKYFQSLLLNEKGNFKEAEKIFSHLATVNPFFEEAVITSAKFSKKYSSDPLKAYNIITDALHEFPESIKLLKAYAIEAKLNGFDEYSRNALIRLQARIGSKAYRSFLVENQLTFLPQDL